MSRIGILGGTFNPPHNAHLLLGVFAREQYQLDEIVVIPGSTFSPNKNRPQIDGSHRLNMTRIACEDNLFLRVSDREIGPKTVYTVETLSALKSENLENEFFFIAGSDLVVTFKNWREPEKIAKLTNFIVAPRFGTSFEEARSVLMGCGAIDKTVLMLDFPRIDISSTLVRERLEAGLDCRYLVPDKVLMYIEENKLYKEAKAGTP
ncbi:MAG TPA: nicotinate-nucleotide adenylyltransferase [Caldisericia bacterium]|nr:nicotinate-nucleotide adenylyltransferase [Caldisericia bacterium]